MAMPLLLPLLVMMMIKLLLVDVDDRKADVLLHFNYILYAPFEWISLRPPPWLSHANERVGSPASDAKTIVCPIGLRLPWLESGKQPASGLKLAITSSGGVSFRVAPHGMAWHPIGRQLVAKCSGVPGDNQFAAVGRG